MIGPLKALAEGPGAENAIRRESNLGYIAENGRYWEMLDRFDAGELRRLDTLWLEASREALAAE